MRIYKLGENSFWMDELFTMEHETGCGFMHMELPANQLMEHPPLTTHLSEGHPWWTVWNAATTDCHPPLYFVLLRGWMGVFGEGEVPVRSFSLVASLVALVLMAHTARLLNGPGPALWGAMLMALAIPQIRHAQDARGYPLLMAFGMGACAALVHIEQRGPSFKRLLALGFCLWAMAMTHYFAIAALAALFVYALVRLPRDSRRRTVQTFVVAGAMFLLVWGPGIWKQWPHLFSQNDWLHEGATHNAWLTLEQWWRSPIALLTAAFDVEFTRGVGMGNPLLDPTAAAGFLFILPVLMLRRRPDLLLWTLWLIAVTGMPAMLDLTRSTSHLLFIRYVLLAGPAVYMLLAALLSHQGRWMKHLVPAAALLLPLTYVQTAYEAPLYDNRYLPQWIAKHAQAEDAVIIPAVYGERDNFGGYLFLMIDYYAHPLPAPVVYLRGQASGELLEQLRQRRKLWVLWWQDVPDMERLVPGAREIKRYSTGMTPMIVEVDPSPATTQPAVR